ncbi:MAG: Uma2 family endonuclease [Gemmataceae bacterium]|nr:Uma2 family endonuclease [Gemmataceae bacterium]
MSLDLEDPDVGSPAVADEPSVTDDEDRKGYELLDGTWVEKEGDGMSALVEANLSRLVGNHVHAHRLGWVLASNARFQLFPVQSNRIRKPDLSFVAAGRFPTGLPAGGPYRFAPDLAAEVHSPTDLVDYTEAKRDEYLRAGVRLVWEAHIPTRNVWAYKPDGTARLYRATDTLPGEDVLPGFAVPVADLFEGLDPVAPVPQPPGANAPGSPGGTTSP